MRDLASSAKILVPVLSLALLTSGCTVGPNFSRPSGWSPSSWFGSQGTPTETPKQDGVTLSAPVAEPIQTEWWAAFGDPQLTDLEKRLAAQNLDLRVATARLAQSRAQRRIAGAAAFPMVNGDANYTRTRESPNGIFSVIGGSASSGSASGSSSSGGGASGGASSGGGFPLSGLGSGLKPFDLYQYGFDASWEIDLWGRVRRSVESADASVEVSQEARRDTLLSSEAELARDYIQLRGTQTLLDISQRNLKTAKDNMLLTRERSAVGMNSQLDVNNSEAQVGNTASAIPQLEQQQAQLINELGYLLGQTPGALAKELITAKPVPPVPPHVPVGLPSELARRRPDILQAEAQLHSATAEIGVSQAAFYPSVSLTGSFDLQAVQFKNLGDWASRTYMIGPSITVPLFEGGRLTGNLELSKAEQQEAMFNYQKTVLNAWQEVDNALVAYDKEQRRRQDLQEAVGFNNRALVLAQDAYRRGLTSFLDVLTAEQQLLAAEQQAASSTVTVSTNLVALYKALGGGWDTKQPMMPQQVASPQP